MAFPQHDQIFLIFFTQSFPASLYQIIILCLKHQYHTKIDESLERAQMEMIRCLVEKVSLAYMLCVFMGGCAHKCTNLYAFMCVFICGIV